MSRRKTKTQRRQETITFIALSGVIVLSIIGVLSYGMVGKFLFGVFRVLLGHYPQVFFGLIIGLVLFYLINPKKVKKIRPRIWIALILIGYVFLNVLAFPHVTSLTGGEVIKYYMSILKTIYQNPENYAYGGLVGSLLYGLSSFLFDRTGTIIVNVFIGLTAFILLFTPDKIIKGFKAFFGAMGKLFSGIWVGVKKLIPAKENKEKDEPVVSISEVETEVVFDPPQPDATANFINLQETSTVIDNNELKLNLEPEVLKPLEDYANRKFTNYQLPPLTLLENITKNSKSSANSNSAKDRGKRVIEVLSQFGIEAELIDIHIGPSVTKFEIKPDSNVKINRIASIQDNMMMELAVTSLRIEAPIPGRAAVGIEIPNQEMVPVRLKEVIRNTPQFYEKENIWVALGKDLMGKSISIALNKMPHLLIAGATGSGKSVSINAIISSLILSKHPEDLKLVLIDPKKVEFTAYMNIPHLMTPVVTDPLQASGALQRVVSHMEDRYQLFSELGVRNIASYNEKVKTDDTLDPLPWIVVVIDELADLMAVSGREVETSIQRITQLARAAGIHLIVATQRPSVDVVTGLIKSNIPSRIAFAVSSSIDSRTILDTVGAEKLLGYGDMLYIPMGAPNPVRVQGVFVSDDEVNALTKYASEQANPQFSKIFEEPLNDSESKGADKAMEDELYEEALTHVLNAQRASTSHLQTYFGIGYNRAARIMNALEQQGIIGPQQGAKPRDIRYESVEAYMASLQIDET